MKQVIFFIGLLSLVSIAAEAVSNKNFAKAPAAVEPEIKNMDVCFSPKEKCDKKIISFIKSAKKSLEVAIYSLTHRDIVLAIKEAKDRGLKVRVIVDREQMAGEKSLVNELFEHNVNVKIGGSKGIMHNKYTIVDGEKIETGSYNYTSSASHFNSENQIYIFEEPVVKEYIEDYEKLWAQAVAE